MTGQEMEHAIQFLLDQHARASVEIQQLREARKEQGANLDKLSDTVAAMAVEMREDFKNLRNEMGEGFSNMRTEMREAFNNLITGNEVTRELAQKAAQLAIATSQRVTKLEQS